MYRLQTRVRLLLSQVLHSVKKEPAMPIQKIPTVSRRFHPAVAGAAVALLGLAGTLAALLMRA